MIPTLHRYRSYKNTYISPFFGYNSPLLYILSVCSPIIISGSLQLFLVTVQTVEKQLQRPVNSVNERFKSRASWAECKHVLISHTHAITIWPADNDGLNG